jgi:hypothetical protein
MVGQRRGLENDHRTLTRKVPSRTVNVTHQKLETAGISLYLLRALGSLEAAPEEQSPGLYEEGLRTQLGRCVTLREAYEGVVASTP